MTDHVAKDYVRIVTGMMVNLFTTMHVLMTYPGFLRSVCDTVSNAIKIISFTVEMDGELEFKAKYWNYDKYIYYDTFPDEKRKLKENVIVFQEEFIISLVKRTIKKGQSGFIK